ncbi:MAG: winged helix-turn-helix transcriptional regulator [Blastocatellia bacterium]|nr:winged helix-turn-helix transcriptional regulator [Blastocatellia bacterium]MCS7158343.1 winged helix-turn-helix transcriptional regulator [Blastocatellia bacterium]MCX7752849.1 winged helix-turn-helix transcriptional regulator [Blastocatellia bacterium]MDW8167905.1 winged helix-turn-helix transcriptional regulator [Acidobacteriota bacterium]MDW8255930.1 winged helix-turn-helix transcriptional regulator [Acidobacteriota bacterium]
MWEEAALEPLRCKWTPLLIRHLAEGVVRPGQLKREIAGISTKVLYERLRDLQRNGFVRALIFEGYPRRAEYHLTERGRELLRVISTCQRYDVPLPLLGEVLKCRWLRDIIALLREGPQRPSALQRCLIGISRKVLSEKLEKLEHLRVIRREVSPTRPVAVWYRLSEEGERLSEVLAALEAMPRLMRAAAGTLSR